MNFKSRKKSKNAIFLKMCKTSTLNETRMALRKVRIHTWVRISRMASDHSRELKT